MAGPGHLDDRGAGVRRVLRDLALPAAAAHARLVRPGHLHRVRQAAVPAARADRGRARRPGSTCSAITSRSPSACSRRSSGCSRRPPRCCSSRRCRPRVSVFPVVSGRVRADRAGDGTADRVRLRLLLGPAADDRLRLPRDRARRAAARVLAVRAGPRPPVAAIALGACRWCSWRRARASPSPRSALLLVDRRGLPALLPGPVAAARPPVAAAAGGRSGGSTGRRGVGAGLCLTAWGLFWSVFAIT